MKVDFGTVLKNLDGEPLLDGPDQKPVVLGKAIAMALAASLEEDKGDTPDVKLKRWHLTNTVWKGETAEISPEDATMIRTRVCKVTPLLVAGQVLDLIK